MPRKSPSRRRRPTTKIRPVQAVPWFKPDQWQRLRERSADAEHLEPTHEAWAAAQDRRIEELERAGISVSRVEVDVDELVDWCQARGLSMDAVARANFAADKLAQR